MKPLRIVSASAEVSPFSKSGGLGDVAAALPKHLAKFGHTVSIVTPYYGFMKRQEIPAEDAGEAAITLAGVQYPVKFKRQQLRERLDIYFVLNEELFGRYQTYMYGHENDALRFAVFDIAVLQLLRHLNLKPDVIHCHDWHTGLIPNILRHNGKDEFFRGTASVFTIHNLPFQMQGNWWNTPHDKIDDGKGRPLGEAKNIRWLNFTRRAIMHADVINTVSVRYAQEILTPEFGQGLDSLLRRRHKDVYGIINGVDYAVYNPQFDQHIWYEYDWNSLDKKLLNKRELQKLVGLDVNDKIPVIGMVHRLTEQKGFELIRQILPVLMRLSLQIVVVGSGDRGYVRLFRTYAKKNPDKLAIFTPFTEELGSKVYAGSDMFLMPSRYEPCGISQLISLRYGSVPIVHETGGLYDTVADFNPRNGRGTGFVFSRYAAEDLLIAIVRALENFKYPQVWEHLTWQAMQESYSWDIPAEQYEQLYWRAMQARRAQAAVQTR